MTNKKQSQERASSRRYQDLVQSFNVEARQPQSRSGELSGRVNVPERRDVHLASRSSRVVSTPSLVQPTSWNVLADRRASLRRQNARKRANTAPVPRRLAQTGVGTNSAQIRAIKRSQMRRASSPVPVRSGRRLQRKSVLMRIFAALFGTALLVLALEFALTSSMFRVQQVRVVGTNNPVLISSIQHMGIQGQNIFLADTTSLTNKIAALPTVKSVELGKQWPDQLHITIVERVPVLLWKLRQGTFSVDSQGVVIAPASATGNTNHLMTVVDENNQASISGEMRTGFRLNPADVQFANQVFRSLPQMTSIRNFVLRYDSNLPGNAAGGANVTYASQEADRSFVLESPTGWSAYLGNADNENPLDNRLIELQQILTYAQKQQLNLATIDLRFGLRPVYTLKS
jgi:hypothetical protein